MRVALRTWSGLTQIGGSEDPGHSTAPLWHPREKIPASNRLLSASSAVAPALSCQLLLHSRNLLFQGHASIALQPQQALGILRTAVGGIELGHHFRGHRQQLAAKPVAHPVVEQ